MDRLDALIEDGMTQTGVPGTAVAVVYNDEVVYEQGFGVRELGKPEAITPETVFQIASLSKPLSSTLVAAVVGDGTTTWDATISSLAPGFALSDPFVSDQVTIRDMLCHRSGLPAYSGDPLVWSFLYDRAECIRRLRSYALATPFRTTMAYSNLGFSSGAYAAASAAGQSWEDLAEARLFAPPLERSYPRCRSYKRELGSGQRRCKVIRQALCHYRAVAGFTPVVPERSRFVPTFRRHCERSRLVTWRPVISPTSSCMPARRRRLAPRPNCLSPMESRHRWGQLDSDSLSAVHGQTEANFDGPPLPLGSTNPVSRARLAT